MQDLETAFSLTIFPSSNKPCLAWSIVHRADVTVCQARSPAAAASEMPAGPAHPSPAAAADSAVAAPAPPGDSALWPCHCCVPGPAQQGSTEAWCDVLEQLLHSQHGKIVVVVQLDVLQNDVGDAAMLSMACSAQHRFKNATVYGHDACPAAAE